MTKLKHYDNLGTARFITFSCYHQYQLLTDNTIREMLLIFRGQNNRLLNKLSVNGRFVFWQKRCYYHNCRTEETVKEKINYCHKNPLNRGLVHSMEDWIYSSYRWYQGMDGIVLEIEGVKL